MIVLNTEIEGWTCHIVETVEDLPEIPDCNAFFMDFETTLYDEERLIACHKKDSLGAFFPYNGDRIAGIAVLYGKEMKGYYIPIRHKIKGKDNPRNLPLVPVQNWLGQHNKISKWHNANPKFDAHFAKADNFDYRGTLVDCLVDSKIYDVEFSGHNLKKLSREWVNLPMGDVDKVKAFLREAKTGDYGELPIDICAQYAVLDCFAARQLARWLMINRREGTDAITETEHHLTGVLYDLESVGMKANKISVMKELRKTLILMIETSTRLFDLTGEEFTNSPKHIHNLLCTQLGLPVLAWTKKKDKNTGRRMRGGPSFDADALLLYLAHPLVKINPTALEVVQCIQTYRTESTFKTMFLETYLKFMDENGILHPNYLQIIRTGRMACKHPNAQQLNKRAKALIIVEEGYAFLSFDASQMEFRIIIHYIKDPDALRAYQEDPETDVHSFVAGSIGFDFGGKRYDATRSQGKTINFAMAFGAGKRKVTAELAGDDKLIDLVSEVADQWILEGKITADDRENFVVEKCYEIASKVWASYHEKFPSMKTTADDAADSTKWKGYAKNLFGRRRYLKPKRARIAFNTAVQGSAMDYIKIKIVRLAPRFNRFLRERGVVIAASVHDEILFYGPAKVLRDPFVVSYIKKELEKSPIKLRVPILWDGGYSVNNWAEAAGEKQICDENGNWVGGRIPKDFYVDVPDAVLVEALEGTEVA